jgi:hypothetical protein
MQQELEGVSRDDQWVLRPDDEPLEVTSRALARAKPRSRKRLIIGLACVLGLGAVLDLGLTFQVKRLRAEARKVGLYIEPADVNPGQRVAEADNGGQVLDQVLGPFVGSQEVFSSEDVDADLYGWARAQLRHRPFTFRGGPLYLDRIRPAMDQFSRLSTFQIARFDRDYSRFPNMDKREYPPLRRAILLLNSEGVYAASKGDWREAQEKMVWAAHAAKLANMDATIGSANFKSQNQVQTLQSADAILGSKWKEGGASDLAVKVLDAIGPAPDPAGSLSEHALMPAILPTIGKDNVFSDDGWPYGNKEEGFVANRLPALAWSLPILSQINESALLGSYIHQLEIARKFDGSYKTLFKQLTDEEDRRSPTIETMLGRSTFFTPSLGESVVNFAQVETYRRLLAQLLEIARIRKTTGKWPSKPPLTGTAATDAFNDKPLVYHPDANGVLIFADEDTHHEEYVAYIGDKPPAVLHPSGVQSGLSRGRARMSPQ